MPRPGAYTGGSLGNGDCSGAGVPFGVLTGVLLGDSTLDFLVDDRGVMLWLRKLETGVEISVAFCEAPAFPPPPPSCRGPLRATGVDACD
jgi:hypothetical protein